MKYLDILLTFLYTLLCKTKKGISVGNKTYIHHNTSITNVSKSGSIKIGNNVRLGSSTKRYHAGMPFPTKLLIDGKDGKIVIGDNSRIIGAYCHASKSIRIGENCLLAAGVNVLDSNGHKTLSSNRTVGRDTPKEIVIGNNVWIGINSIILKGTVIGDNSIVAAGSVVKGVFPDNCIIQGNPARVVKNIEMGITPSP